VETIKANTRVAKKERVVVGSSMGNRAAVVARIGQRKKHAGWIGLETGHG